MLLGGDFPDQWLTTKPCAWAKERMEPRVLPCSTSSSCARWLIIGAGHFFQKTGILTGHKCWGVTLSASPAQPSRLTAANLRPPVKLGPWSPPWSWESLGPFPLPSKSCRLWPLPCISWTISWEPTLCHAPWEAIAASLCVAILEEMGEETHKQLKHSVE